VAGFSLVASVVALGFGLLLLWRMQAGMADQRDYGYTTAILQVPIWWGFVPILGSLALLAAAAVVTLWEGARGVALGPR
jgi:TRAP-type C4-dicarboxylate transport system permease small subunit